MDYSTEEFVKFAKDADLLIIECGLPDRFGGGRHLSPSIVGEVAKKSGAKTVVPIHFYPQVENEDIKGAIKKQYKGKVIVAKDLMKLSI
jgi:ribonuclease BN (tRNA processing enzyme)